MNEKRKSPRRVATALGMKGFMALIHKLHSDAVRELLKKLDGPQPHVIEVALRDVSENGGGVQVEIISQMSEEEIKELADLLEELKVSDKMGIQPLPILLIFNNGQAERLMGVPATVRNTRPEQRVGLQISEGSYAKFAGLANAGKEFFRSKFAELVTLEAEETTFQMRSDSLPADAKSRVGEPVVSWMAEKLGMPKEVASKFDIRKRLMVIFIHFLAGKGKTQDFWDSICSAMNIAGKDASYDKAAITAVETLFTPQEKDEFWRIAKSEFAAKTPAPAQPSQKPAVKAPDGPPESWADLPKPRKDYLHRACEKFIVEGKTLEIIIDVFLNKLLVPNDELNVFLNDNPDMMIGRKKKTTVNIWFRSACQANRKGIDDLFKQAVYETIKKRDPLLKNFRLDPTDREDLLNGKLANSSIPGFDEIEDRFYMGVCQAIKGGTLNAFETYKEKYDEETIRRQKEKNEKGKISEMSREDLLARYLIDTILKVKVHNLNEIKKAAMGLLGKDDYRTIVGAGGVIVVNEEAFEYLNRISGGRFGKSSLFTDADLISMYSATEKAPNGNEVKQTFGMFVDNLKPDDLREAIITKTISHSFAWNKLYIIRAGQDALEGVFGQKFFEALKILKDNMLKAEADDGGVA
ncbi:MAG: hypothetical protein HQK85_06040 [Nitrospinae bacterium]|nr:hypothetical protein [Nitrospinota bacterium]